MPNAAKPDKNSIEYRQQQVNSGRSAVLAVLLFTVINLVLLVLDTDRYFLFSAAVPYYLTLFAIIFDGGVGTLTAYALVASGLILVLYLGIWLLSKKHPGWLIVAAVLFVLDTLALAFLAFAILEDGSSFIFDFVIHALVMWQGIQGAIAAGKLKKLQQAPIMPEGYRGTTPDLDPQKSNTPWDNQW